MRKAVRLVSVLLLFLIHSLAGGAGERSSERIGERKEKKVAVASLVTTSPYVAGAEVLAKSLDEVYAIGDRILFYLLPEDDPRSDLTQKHLIDLKDAGWDTRRLSKKGGTLSECFVSEAEQELLTETPSLERYWGTCSKFAVWSLTDYDAVIYIDSDSLVLNNFDTVYDMVLEEAKKQDVVFFANGTPGYWDDPPSSDEFYGAFFAIRPSLELQQFLHKVAQTYSAAQGELMLLNSVFKQTWKPLPRYTLVAQTEQLRPPTDPPSIGVDWRQVKVYDFSGLPQTKPWVTYELQKQTGDRYLHPYLGEIPEGTRNFHIYMYPQWVWNDIYDTVLERKKQRRENGICNDNHQA